MTRSRPLIGGQKWTPKVAVKSGPQKWRSKKDPKSVMGIEDFLSEVKQHLKINPESESSGLMIIFEKESVSAPFFSHIVAMNPLSGRTV